MPQPYLPRPAALVAALAAAGTRPSSIRKAAILDALRVEAHQPTTSTPQGLTEAVTATS